MKINLKKLLLKCKKKDSRYVLTHTGFINNCDLTDDERDSLNNLAEELDLESGLVITFEDIAITSYITGYNGRTVVAGIKFNKLEKWT